MNYFDPQLLARCRSRDDDEADAAAAEWDRAAERYRARFDAIADRLPAAVARLCADFSLHDAKLLGAAVAEQAYFGVLLQLPGAAGVLHLEYRPAAGQDGGVVVSRHAALGRAEPSRDVWVLYDEFDERPGAFVHRLLLSDGREVEVRFDDLGVRLLSRVVQPPSLAEGELKWPAAEVPA